jgi:hypothetical protein
VVKKIFMQKKHIFILSVAVAAVGISGYMIAKKINKNKLPDADAGQNNIINNNSSSNGNFIEVPGVERNSWDDAGGYRISAGGGWWNYYDKNGALKGRGTDAGGWYPYA